MDTNSLFEVFEKDFTNMPPYNEGLLKQEEADIELLKFLFSCIDLTSLNTHDSSNSISDFCDKVVNFQKSFPEYPNVAAVCVYPVFASILSTKLKGMDVNRAVVSAGFPSSQTFLETK